MKKFLLSIILVSSFSGFSQILSEDFESGIFPPDGWTTSTLVPTRPWGLTTDIFNATGQATFDINGIGTAAIGWIAQDNVADLTSPAFSLVGYGDAIFDFNVKIGFEYMVDPFPNGDLEVQISTDGSNWTTLWVEEDQGVFVDYETLSISLDLAAYLGEANVQVRFLYSGNDADSLSVDDIMITGNLGVQQVLASSFTTFPNPTRDVISISNNENIVLNSIKITDINGRTVKQIQADEINAAPINVSELSSGVYFMTISSNAGNAVKKFIKN